MTIDILTELYDKGQFQRMKDSCLISEPEKDVAVKSADFLLKGAEFIVCANENIWNNSVRLYTKESVAHSFRFKKACDGFVICTYKGQRYLIWIELKSSFGEVFNKAIYQLSACYIKTKSYLNCFSSYHPEEYKELGIVVSMPEGPYKENEGNEAVENRRGSLIAKSDTLTDIYRSDYRNATTPNVFFLRGEDFGIKNAHLSDSIALDILPVYYYETTDESSTINLDTILSKF